MTEPIFSQPSKQNTLQYKIYILTRDKHNFKIPLRHHKKQQNEPSIIKMRTLTDTYSIIFEPQKYKITASR